ADAKEAAEANDCEHDAIRHLFQHDVLDGADAVASGVVNRRADDLRRSDGVGVSARCMHVHRKHSSLLGGTCEENDRRSRKFRRIEGQAAFATWSSAISFSKRAGMSLNGTILGPSDDVELSGSSCVSMKT